MGSGFLGTRRHTRERIPRSRPPDSIIGNYSKHPPIRTRGKSLVAEISRFDTQKYVYKNLFGQARSNSLMVNNLTKECNFEL